MLKRKAYRDLQRWKEKKNKQGMLLTGARQVGKTYLIRAFAKEEYDNFIEINLIENRRAASLIDSAENSNDLISRISLFSGQELVPGKTLIFIDEAQKSKEILTAIKFLVDRTEYDFILSGSLLGVELEDIRSVPVGYLDVVTMFPMDFEEFCWANKIPNDALEKVRDSFTNRTPVPDYIHDRLTSLYAEYLIVGGMPNVVDSFISTRDLERVRNLQKDIVTLYKKDIAQYNKDRSLIIKSIYDLIPSEINKQNKRFILRDLKKNAKFDRFEEDFLWLTEAGVALSINIVSEPVYPLKISRSTNLFKLFLSDVGLLTGILMKDTAIDILEKSPNINYGAIYENMVAQELKAHGHDLYYYNSKKRGEIDFVIESGFGEVALIEVKSGKDYKRHNALTGLINSGDYTFSGAYVLCDSNVQMRNNILYMPNYMICCF